VFCIHFGNYFLPPFALGCRTLGNSGGHLSFASLNVLASLLVIPNFSRSDSEITVTLHPTVLNSSAALLVSSMSWATLLGLV
jgi:hypothetical protein